MVRLDRRPKILVTTTVRRYLAMPFARRTFANRLRALMQFSLVSLTPGYNFQQFERDR